ncbi:MAG: Rrf2 family transcriptional regulator [Sediminibacterium sp.]
MLSKKTQYAFKALTYIAEHKKDGPILIADISQKKKIPLKFLENILLELKKAGLLDSKKGKGGGYFFNVEPGKIPLAQVMRLIEGPIALLPCVSLNFYQKCTDCNEKKCGMNRIMIEVRDNMLKVLENKTVAELAAT